MATDSEGEARPFPHPLGPVSSLQRQLDEALASMPPPKAGEPVEGPSRLARAWDRARLYAYPKNHPDWGALERARRHRDAMPPSAGGAPGESLLAPARWELLGPKAFDRGGGRWVSGRVNAIAVDPGSIHTMYLGAAGGGVWKSYDRGDTWEPLSNTWPFQEVASIAIDPKNRDTIYVGTGDFHAWSARSFGLMKSTDGGRTWTNLAVAEAGAVSISDIVVDLAQPAVVIMCGGRGRQGYGYVWRSTDGGRTFARAIDVAAEWAKLAVGREDGSGNQPYYAAGWNGSGGLLYRSLDHGQTWTQLSPPWGARQWGISVAASRVDTNNVYVMAGVDRRIYASGDRGATWRDISANVRRDDFEWHQLWYDWALACNASGGARPHDRLYLGLLHLQVWDAELGTWKEAPHGHDDVHALVPHPGEQTTLLIGNDGGAYELFDIDFEFFLKPLNKQLCVTECYRSAGGCLAATQDNAAASGLDLNNWRMVFPATGGDAIAACVSPTNPSVQFVEGGVAFHGIRRTADSFASPGVDITPDFQGQDRLDPFAMPIVMDSRGTRLYFGTDYL